VVGVEEIGRVALRNEMSGSGGIVAAQDPAGVYAKITGLTSYPPYLSDSMLAVSCMDVCEFNEGEAMFGNDG